LSQKLLNELESILDTENAVTTAVLLAEARARARWTAEGAGVNDASIRLAAVGFAADALASRIPGRSISAAPVEALVASIATATDASPDAVRTELYGRTLRALLESDLPPDLAVEAVLAALTVFAPVMGASLWLGGNFAECVAYIGDARPTRRMRAAARGVLAGDQSSGSKERGFVHGMPIVRWRRPIGALVVRARPADQSRARALAGEACAAVGPLLERDILLRRAADRERALVQTGERRLTRLGFDIHDGPLQEVAALAGELRLFRSQLNGVAREHAFDDLFLDRLDDCVGRLLELDRDLRELAFSLESPTLTGRPLAEFLRRHARAFEKRSGITVSVETRGDFNALTPSQRLAIVRLIQEALTNVREHSGARAAAVRVTARHAHTEAVVTDDGRGFDVERTLVMAAHRGRLGLVGMSERVRLLGGVLAVESRPGGPTTIAAALPRWEPLGVASSSSAAAGAAELGSGPFPP
jgi:signal transduction histidine kinase